MDFKPIYLALENRLRADLGGLVAAVSRENLPATAFPTQPALVVLETTLAPSGGHRTPVLWELGATLILHSQVSGDNARPGEQILDVVAAIDAALSWRDGEPRSDGMSRWTTLGGAVLWAELEDASIEDDSRDPRQVATVLHVKMSARG